MSVKCITCNSSIRNGARFYEDNYFGHANCSWGCATLYMSKLFGLQRKPNKVYYSNIPNWFEEEMLSRLCFVAQQYYADNNTNIFKVTSNRIESIFYNMLEFYSIYGLAEELDILELMQNLYNHPMKNSILKDNMLRMEFSSILGYKPEYFFTLIKLEEIKMTNTPLFTHDCSECKFIKVGKSYFDEIADIYVCGTVVIYRLSNTPSDNRAVDIAWELENSPNYFIAKHILNDADIMSQYYMNGGY